MKNMITALCRERQRFDKMRAVLFQAIPVPGPGLPERRKVKASRLQLCAGQGGRAGGTRAGAASLVGSCHLVCARKNTGRCMGCFTEIQIYVGKTFYTHI